MKKKGNQYPLASRADSGDAMSYRFARQFACCKGDFRAESTGMKGDGMDESDDCVFLMNCFYGEKVIFPMIECVRREFPGAVGLSLAIRLEREMQEKNGRIRGDDLLDVLKEEVGLDCAVSLIGQLGRFRKTGLCGSRMVTRLLEPAACQWSSLKAPSGKRSHKPEKTDCVSEKGACRGCVPEKEKKEKMNWKKNAKTK